MLRMPPALALFAGITLAASTAYSITALSEAPQLDRATLIPRAAAVKPAQTEVPRGADASRLVVKYREGVQVRMDRGELSASAPGLHALFSELQAVAPEASFERLFRRSEATYDAERRRGEANSGRALADLNNYYLLWLDEPVSAARAASVCDLLNTHELVEIAYLPAPASDPDNCVDESPTTPDWTTNQNYRNPAPMGVDAAAAWAAGSRGSGWRHYWVVDVEQGWNVEHEDLNIDIGDVLNGPYNNEKRDHGTAVLGEIAACEGSFGMTGLVPDVRLKTCDWNLEPTIADAFDIAASYLAPGEIYLIEIQTWGGYNYVPMEFEQANFDAIQNHTAQGIIVVEAGANGSQDLDDETRYDRLFDRTYRDSGAILVGAAVAGSHVPEYFTNYGSRIDAHGYGSNVYSTGYGDLWEPEIDQAYTDGFSGTSSASPMVTGAAASTWLLGHELTGRVLTPFEVRDLLSTYGTPQGEPLSKHIGPMPDLAEIIDNLPPGGGWIMEMMPNVESVGIGDAVRIFMRVTNTTGSSATTDVWTEVLLSGDNRWPVARKIYGPTPITLAGGASQILSFSLRVPGGAALGTYIAAAYAGEHPGAPRSASFAHVVVE